MFQFKFTQKIVSFLLFLCAFGTMNAEYLVYRMTNEKPEAITDKAEHKKIFNIFMRYQYPMRTNPSFEIEKELSQKEIDLMKESEQEFLEHLVQTRVSDDLRVLFVPTVLYELFLIRFFINPDQLKENLTEEDYSSEELFLTSRGNFFLNRYLRQRKNKIDDLKNIAASKAKEEYEKQVTALNTSDDLCFAHHILNKHLFSYILNRVDFDGQKLTTETSQKIFKNFYLELSEFKKVYISNNENLETYWKKHVGNHLLWDNTSNKKDQKQIVSRAIEIEYEAESSNLHILYRAAKIHVSNDFKKYIDSSISSNYTTDYSTPYCITSCSSYIISYSSNLFSGSYEDFKSGCSYPIMGSLRHKLGIAIFIDKSAINNDLFFIPAYNTLVNTLLGKGEFYHPRSKMTQTQLNHETTGLERYNELGGNFDLFFQFLTTSLSEEQKDFEYSSFISKNTRFLTSKINITQEDIRNLELEKELLRNHAKLAEQLKTQDCPGGEEME
ncbi:hypothetical protein KAT92_01825 [Candidatus Babeliales bacterium]|nr:hypothetical protein [Candidatus Babeliales bacterium]